jgi:pimeloyl-ACP methyl ester carboxylesterase
MDDLIRHGHNAFAPTMSGRGEGVPTRITHAELCQPIVDLIVERDLSDVILVGHSYGGTAISKVVELFPNRVRRLVYVAGYVLDDGDATADANPPHYRQLFQELATSSADHTVRLPFDIWRHCFVNDGDDDLARSTYAKLWPEPYQPLIEPLDLKKFYSLSIPTSYILGQDDIVQPEGAEWGWRPRFTDRLGKHRFLDVGGGHELIFTNPEGLAAKLIEAARDYKYEAAPTPGASTDPRANTTSTSGQDGSCAGADGEGVSA